MKIEFWCKYIKGRDHMGDHGADRIILKLILMEYDRIL
jgi:hypothetical protein